MKKLRTGVTTGLCAAAAAKAAVIILLSGDTVSRIEIEARNGDVIQFTVTDAMIETDSISCAVRKDAGDDPDITNNIKVFASVSKTNLNGIAIDGGEGIGRVTKPGLKIPVGEAAINPVPLQMIKSAIEEVCSDYAYTGGIKAVISIPGGAGLAKKTMNERLGIVGGLSVLGTTGIVEPMSNRAVVETIKAEIDVQMASGKKTLVITPGNYGRDFAESELGVDIEGAVKCSNFIGEALDYACEKGVSRLLLIGHAGKLVKLAGGIMNTHSAIADSRMEILAAHAAITGADKEVIKRIMDCVTTKAAIDILKQFGVSDPVWKSIGRKIGFHLNERVRGKITLEYVVFTQEHGVLVRGETAGGETAGYETAGGETVACEIESSEYSEKKGKLFGIGTGPGDPELLTIKAVNTIRDCDVIAVPKAGGSERTAFLIIEKYLEGKEQFECRFSMDKDLKKREEARQIVADEIIKILESGKNVGYITLGDPTTYSTYMYIHKIITGKGFEAEIIPGVTSFAAAAAAFGVALCEGNEALTIIPAGHVEETGELLDRPGNKVIMKSGDNLTSVLRSLKEHGQGDKTKIACRATMAGQRLYDNIDDFEKSPDSGYFTIAIVKEKI